LKRRDPYTTRHLYEAAFVFDAALAIALGAYALRGGACADLFRRSQAGRAAARRRGGAFDSYAL